MITYQQAVATKKALMQLGWPDCAISAKRGNSPNADGEKWDRRREADNMDAETFKPDEAYDDYTLRYANDGASVKGIRDRFVSRGDGLNDFLSTADEYKGLPDTAINCVLNWPGVRAAYEAELEKARKTMGV